MDKSLLNIFDHKGGVKEGGGVREGVYFEIKSYEDQNTLEVS